MIELELELECLLAINVQYDIYCLWFTINNKKCQEARDVMHRHGFQSGLEIRTP